MTHQSLGHTTLGYGVVGRGFHIFSRLSQLLGLGLPEYVMDLPLHPGGHEGGETRWDGYDFPLLFPFPYNISSLSIIFFVCLPGYTSGAKACMGPEFGEREYRRPAMGCLALQEWDTILGRWQLCKSSSTYNHSTRDRA